MAHKHALWWLLVQGKELRKRGSSYKSSLAQNLAAWRSERSAARQPLGEIPVNELNGSSGLTTLAAAAAAAAEKGCKTPDAQPAPPAAPV